jgi:hypothetical protein
VGRSCRGVPERLDQDEVVRILGTSRPLEEDVARLRSGGGREVGDEGEPIFRVIWTDRKFDDDEDHRLPLSGLDNESARMTGFGLTDVAEG